MTIGRYDWDDYTFLNLIAIEGLYTLESGSNKQGFKTVSEKCRAEGLGAN